MSENRSFSPSGLAELFLPCPCCPDGRMVVKKNPDEFDSPSESENDSCLSSGDAHEKLEVPVTYICQLCDNQFDNRSTFCEHECYKKIQRKGNILKKGATACKVCHKSFSSTLNLRRHIHTCHSMINYMCQICEKKFPKQYLLKIHYRTHTGEKPYRCQTCGRGFTSSVLLWSHEKFSHAEKGYQCDTCSEFYATRQMLGNHIRVKHTNERSLHCEICGKKFLSTSVFYQHKATHSDVRKHGCDICSMRFKRLSTLRKHELIHTDTRPHSCLICGKSFRQLGDLKRHCNVVHSGQVDTI